MCWTVETCSRTGDFPSSCSSGCIQIPYGVHAAEIDVRWLWYVSFDHQIKNSRRRYPGNCGNFITWFLLFFFNWTFAWCCLINISYFDLHSRGGDLQRDWGDLPAGGLGVLPAGGLFRCDWWKGSLVSRFVDCKRPGKWGLPSWGGVKCNLLLVMGWGVGIACKIFAGTSSLNLSAPFSLKRSSSAFCVMSRSRRISSPAASMWGGGFSGGSLLMVAGMVEDQQSTKWITPLCQRRPANNAAITNDAPTTMLRWQTLRQWRW